MGPLEAYSLVHQSVGLLLDTALAAVRHAVAASPQKEFMVEAFTPGCWKVLARWKVVASLGKWKLSYLNVQLDVECAEPANRIVFLFSMDGNYFYTLWHAVSLHSNKGTRQICNDS